MVSTYFEIGRMIVQEEQNGELRAEYSTQLIKNLSVKLLNRYRTGYSQRNIEQMRQFYVAFTKTQTVSAELTEDSKTVGIILCRDKSDILVDITLPIDNYNIFASRYQTVLPSKEEFKRLIDNKNQNYDLRPIH